MQHLGHRVARSTIAKILRAHGISPAPDRPLSWRTFLAAHWGTIAADDFFTTDVWTVRGLVTYYTVFVIELESRRVHIAGSTPHPDDAFVLQVARAMTDPGDGMLRGHRVLICDRDAKWSLAFRQLLGDVGVRVVQTPYRAPNCNAHAERFVRTIKEECLDRLLLIGEARLRRTLAEFGAHYTASGITRASRTGSSHPNGRDHPAPLSVVARDSVDSSTTITEPPDGSAEFSDSTG